MTDAAYATDRVPSETSDAFAYRSDAEWADATARVRQAAMTYEHVDFGRLAEDAVDAYVQSRSRVDDAAAQPGLFGAPGVAVAATAGMMTAFVASQSDQGRGQSLVIAGISFLGPLIALLMIVYGIHSSVGWAGVSTPWLGIGFALAVSASVAMVASFVRDGRLIAWAPKQGALGLSIGAIAATLVSALSIQQLRSGERKELEILNTAVIQSVTDDVAAGANPLRGIQRLAEKQDRYDLVAGKDKLASERSLQAKGVPGYLTVKIEAPDAASVVRSQPLRASVTQSLVRQGRVEAAADGSRRLVTADGSYAVSSAVPSSAVIGEGRAVGLIDPATRTVTRLTPSTVAAGMAR